MIFFFCEGSGLFECKISFAGHFSMQADVFLSPCLTFADSEVANFAR